MGVENPSHIGELNPDAPLGTESISEGDNHIRAIKSAIQKTFPEVKGTVTWSPADFQKVLDFVNNYQEPEMPELPKGNGVFASLKYNGPTQQVMYGHNIDQVEQYDATTTRVYFKQPTDGFDNHYAVQITPVAQNARPVLCHVTDQRSNYVQFNFAEWDGVGMGPPIGPCGFYMTMVDMIQVEENSEF